MVVNGCFFNTYSIIMIPTQNININIEIQICKSICVKRVTTNRGNGETCTFDANRNM